MVKEFDKGGIPVIHMAHLLPIAKSVGSSRIVQTQGIPFPLGNPELSKEDEYKMRYQLVEKALHAMCDDTKEQKVYE